VRSPCRCRVVGELEANRQCGLFEVHWQRRERVGRGDGPDRRLVVVRVAGDLVDNDALNTGLRKSEFLGLRWRDVDFKAGVLTIPHSKNGEARHVPMNATVREILARFPRPLDRAALVFPNGESKRDLRWAEKTVPAAVSAAKIEDFRLHDTRHTFASRLAIEGVDLLALKALGGWKTLSMVQRYAHLSPGHQRSAIPRLVTRQRTREAVQAAGTSSTGISTSDN